VVFLEAFKIYYMTICLGENIYLVYTMNPKHISLESICFASHVTFPEGVFNFIFMLHLGETSINVTIVLNFM